MASRRTLKAAEAIREVVAMSLLTEIKDPRVKNVTVTSVDVSADMRNAKVYITVMGGETVQEELALSGLRSAAGFLQQKCARRIDTRYTPRLQFMIDEGIKNLIAVSRILDEEKKARQQEMAALSAADDSDTDTGDTDTEDTDTGDFDTDDHPDTDEPDDESGIKGIDEPGKVSTMNQIEKKDQIEEASNEK